MKISLLLASAALLAPVAVQTAPSTSEDGERPAPITPPPVARLPGFSAELAQRRPIYAPAGWTRISSGQAWDRLVAAKGSTARQSARWDMARSLVAAGRAPEALGVLDVMLQDDPDLAMVDSFRLARGAVAAMMEHPDDALAALSAPGLAANPEACAWRLRALSEAGLAEQALLEVGCAGAALRARDPNARAPFVLAAARAGVEGGAPARALGWLAQLPDRDPAANLYRGRAYMALGQPAKARLRLARAEHSGTAEQRIDARLTTIEGQVAIGAIKPDQALKQLEALRFAWRGDHIEERALQLSYRVSSASNDVPGALSAGAVLFRYYRPARQEPDFVPGLQAQLASVLAPASRMPLDRAAGLFWDYRDIMPAGAQADLLVSRLGERLQAAGLYARAAELFEHQLFVRAVDLAQGPLSVRVASLHILAGRPDRAVETLHRSGRPDYTDEMLHDRERVEAVALSQLGKVDEAFAVLQDVPDAGALRSEILWRKRDWSGLVAEGEAGLPHLDKGAKLNEVEQVRLLRHAIALAMVGHEDALSGLRQRYASAFAGLSTAPVFDMLTGSARGLQPDALVRAMTSLPSASPAGVIGELLDGAPPPSPIARAKTAAAASGKPAA